MLQIIYFSSLGLPSWVEFIEKDLKEHNIIECVVQDDYLDYENQYYQDDTFENFDVSNDAPDEY